ncbi:MAG: GNAT family N-acetyltransferase [Thermoleophilia bacterium]|nr:GNAT family N-acetyltransferase [Thermoleophilia bacterium]
MSELETERLLLRRWRDGDLAGLARLNADPSVVRYLTPGGRAMSRAESEEQLRRFRRHWREHGFGLWAVEEKASGRLVGRIGLQYHRLWPTDPEVGWKLDPAVWGRGYATEGGRASIRHAFETLGVPRVVSIVHPDNAPSIAVMERLGLALAGRPWWTEGDLELLRYALERSRP